uniref:Uncharacterized protein n=1 Tax=Chromera velia CCMP2878 TaxID=1169474 RepID=A0A0G4G8E8_9ALVE|eukprot:Cvel_4288.t1-p1 / transcript=Cvel_4288.t1 / gene=Cvel_4288 / organism=Chromera_velia_CCMP2878 / gene_product=hypothetical protein / transcript_product=hypothetical protein / location=Cvel_scaffold186:33795-35144(-) / protein_length=125 / sequence_SO=supercontig / SO=protein_coding / is_pseudo=false
MGYLKASFVHLCSTILCSVDDVKLEIGRHKNAAATAGPQGASSDPSVHDLTVADRERALELLLSQQRVVSLLYEKTFPERPTTPLIAPPPGEDIGGFGEMLPERTAEMIEREVHREPSRPAGPPH